jgi:ribosomal protein S18 acetylase RimI-like enzyme
MKIRRAIKQDLKELVKLDKEANKEIKWWTPLKESDFLKFLKEGNLLFVADENNLIVGYQSAKIPEKTLILEDIYIKKEFRNKKIATKLIKKTILEGKKYRAKQIRFNCPERLRKFYEELGFKVTSLVMTKKIIK